MNQAIEAYIELSLDIEAEEERTKSYPHKISHKLFDLMVTMTKAQIKEAEEVLAKIRSTRAMGNL